MTNLQIQQQQQQDLHENECWSETEACGVNVFLFTLEA